MGSDGETEQDENKQKKHSRYFWDFPRGSWKPTIKKKIAFFKDPIKVKFWKKILIYLVLGGRDEQVLKTED